VARGLLSPAAMTKDRKPTSLGWATAEPSTGRPPAPPDQDFASPDHEHEPGASYSPASAPPLVGYPAYAAPSPPPHAYNSDPHAGYPPAAAYPAYAAPAQPPYAPYNPPPHGGYPQAAAYPAYTSPQDPPHNQAPSAGYQHGAAPPPAQAAPPVQRPIHKASTGVSQRVRFLRLTYLHLLLAIAAFAGLLRLLVTNPVLGAKVSAPLVKFALGGRWNWGVVLVVFMAVSWVADAWASHARSRAVQYLGLAFYIVAEALIFVPLLAIVEWKTQAILARGGAEPHIVRDAAFVTLGVFTALTASVFLSRKDFSFLRSGLAMASGAALSLIAMSLVFGFNLGLAFSVAMVLLAAGYMLYHTSRVLADHDPRHHVAAALALFSSVALMFWYVIRIFLRARE